MKYVPVEEARKQLGRLVQEVREEGPVRIGRRGKDQAVLMSDTEYARLQRAEEEAAKMRFEAARQPLWAQRVRAGSPSVWSMRPSARFASGEGGSGHQHGCVGDRMG